AADRVNALIERAKAKGVELPPLPAPVSEWPAWIASVSAQVRSMLPGGDTTRAFDAGLAAASWMQAWGVAEKLAYLRKGDMDERTLADEAARHAATIPPLTARLDEVLAGIHRPMVARKLGWLRRRFERGPRSDATSSPGYSSIYLHIA